MKKILSGLLITLSLLLGFKANATHINGNIIVDGYGQFSDNNPVYFDGSNHDNLIDSDSTNLIYTSTSGGHIFNHSINLPSGQNVYIDYPTDENYIVRSGSIFFITSTGAIQLNSSANTQLPVGQQLSLDYSDNVGIKESGGSFFINTSGAPQIFVDSSGNIVPAANGTQNIGSDPNNYVGTIFSRQLKLNSQAHLNDSGFSGLDIYTGGTKQLNIDSSGVINGENSAIQIIDGTAGITLDSTVPRVIIGNGVLSSFQFVGNNTANAIIPTLGFFGATVTSLGSNTNPFIDIWFTDGATIDRMHLSSDYIGGAPTATGYVKISINGVNYKFLVSN